MSLSIWQQLVYMYVCMNGWRPDNERIDDLAGVGGAGDDDLPLFSMATSNNVCRSGVAGTENWKGRTRLRTCCRAYVTCRQIYMLCMRVGTRVLVCWVAVLGSGCSSPLDSCWVFFPFDARFLSSGEGNDGNGAGGDDAMLYMRASAPCAFARAWKRGDGRRVHVGRWWC